MRRHPQFWIWQGSVFMNKPQPAFAPFLVLLALLACLPLTARADNDLDIRNQLAITIANAWQADDFATLESLENEYRDPAKRTPSGKRLLSLFEQDLSPFICICRTQDTLDAMIHGKSIADSESRNGPDPSLYFVRELEWRKVEAKIDSWQKAYPDSPNPVLARVNFHINKANYFRGSRWASKVHEQAWPIYRENYQAARKLLVESRDLTRKNPIWFSFMLSVLGAQSAPRSEIDAAIADTLENGQGYPNALYAAFFFMQPRWGGSYAQMDEFARLANQKTERTENGEVYARLYWNMVSLQSGEMNREFFERTGASWPLLKASFERLVGSHPEPRNLTAYALFSCLANDTEGARRLLRRANTAVYFESWPRSLQNECAP